jgi:hypothetical protein
MTEQDLLDFRRRCVAAQTNHRTIAKAEHYAARLEEIAGSMPLDRGMPKNSTQHLLALTDKALRVLSGEETATAKAAPKKAAKKAAKKKSSKTAHKPVAETTAADSSDSEPAVDPAKDPTGPESSDSEHAGEPEDPTA